jgi:hypothetical protein
MWKWGGKFCSLVYLLPLYCSSVGTDFSVVVFDFWPPSFSGFSPALFCGGVWEQKEETRADYDLVCGDLGNLASSESCNFREWYGGCSQCSGGY